MTALPTTASYSPGLAGVIADQTKLSMVDGTNGVLTYLGIDIHELAEQASFEEVCYLLWHAKLPSAAELHSLKAELAANRNLPQQAHDLIRSYPTSAVPMDVLRSLVSFLAAGDPEVEDISIPATQRKGIRLTAKFPTLVAAVHRARAGQPFVAPDPKLHHAVNFLYMLSGQVPEELAGRAANLYFVLLADHSFNASTFTARVVASTRADLHSAVTAALGALKGPLHGGAAEATMKMLLEIGSLERVDAYIDAAFERKQKIWGIGHRIYKSGDPRATHLLAWARKMEEARGGGQQYVDMAEAVEQAVLRHKPLYPNVDFFSAPLLYYLGIPIDFDSCVFACSRVAGWTAHVIEQIREDVLVRPSVEYTGPTSQHYVPLQQRG